MVTAGRAEIRTLWRQMDQREMAYARQVGQVEVHQIVAHAHQESESSPSALPVSASELDVRLLYAKLASPASVLRSLLLAKDLRTRSRARGCGWTTSGSAYACCALAATVLAPYVFLAATSCTPKIRCCGPAAQGTATVRHPRQERRNPKGASAPQVSLHSQVVPMGAVTVRGLPAQVLVPARPSV